ncbi:MAG: bifunctional DNA-formamidopyrimidine glycosylase/DNA-(apurinic or apyrimidinic site) lyase [candidate division Zixibacteria bacterium]|nr:bifunctional DNA-formamidopyrimidine glycosylase/DNA-(apurinic or apyrimidinic site) lyase [candidate division Zixibacteria bacterium]
MPELPEVETIARGLQKVIVGKRIKEVEAIFPGIIRQDLDLFKKAVAQKKIQEVRRRGKYLLLDLSGGKTILVHLGMTGTLLCLKSGDRSGERLNRRPSKPKPTNKHDHLAFRFCGSDLELRYNDQRKFGKWKVCDTCSAEHIAELSKLGPESLGLTDCEFVQIFRGRRGRIKSALLNQQIIAGLGNIYADESLFEARINPSQRLDLLSERKLKNLHKAIRNVLSKAIKAGGSSVDNYLNVNGQLGSFQFHHKVYGREGEACKRCGAKIKRIRISQRSSYFCPRCQPSRKA